MSYVLPAAQGLRTLYVLSLDRLWFAAAVLLSLLVAGELVQLFLSGQLPAMGDFYKL
ncbi:MAG: hypothetical protein R3D60_06760 [Paracoccaceae bacterium]